MDIKKQNQFWNSFAGRYDSFISRFAKETYGKSLQLINKELKKTDKVLEIGTGTGLIAFGIASKVNELVATDYAPEMLKRAKEKLAKTNLKNVTFKVCNANSIDYSNNSFDVAIASNVFHLIPSANKALKELHRVLKNDGKIIIPTYCHGQNLKTRIISAFMGLSGFRAANRWSVSQFKRFVEEEDFHIEKEIIIKDKIPMLFIVASKK